MDRYIVISSDCHAGLPPEQYRQYLDPQYREKFDAALPLQLAMIKKAEKSMLIQEINDQWREGIEQQLTGAWDHPERIKMLDTDGIAGEIIYPDGITEMNTPPFGAGLGLPVDGVVPELQWAGARAHNRWLAELCQMAPERHVGVAVLPLLWDIEEAIKEVRWAAQNGLRAVLIPHMIGTFEPYHHKRYYPFWAVCQELGVVVNFHSGSAPRHEYFGKNWPNEAADDYPGAVGIYVSEVFMWTYRPLTFLLWGGVFERYPNLRVAVTETGYGYMLPPFLKMLDHNYYDVQHSAKLGDFRSHLKMSPSEYFRRNVAIGASCIGRQDVEACRTTVRDQIMWGSDYPHPEGTWPHTHREVFDAFRGLPESDVAPMLGENAVRFYDMDRDGLAKIAARVGPSKAELAAA